MATKLTKTIERELKIKDQFGHEGDVVVTMTGSGLELRKKGFRRKLFVKWEDLGKVTTLPATAPSKFVGNPLGWLVQE